MHLDYEDLLKKLECIASKDLADTFNDRLVFPSVMKLNGLL